MAHALTFSFYTGSNILIEESKNSTIKARKWIQH
jgi:hypothetical protein